MESANNSVNDLAGARVMVIDDSNTIRRSAEIFLLKAGCEVILAEDGFDALAIVAIDCRNDGSPVTLTPSPPAPPAGDIFNYDQCVSRLAALFASRFPRL